MGPIDSNASIDRRRAIAENGSDLIIQTNLEGLVTYMSASVEHLTGFRRDEFLGRSIAQLLGVTTATRLREVVKERLSNPSAAARGVEYSFTHKDGRVLWFEARPSPLLDAVTGRQIGVTDVVRDITESRTARTELEFANIQLKVQIEAFPNAILVIDAKSSIVSYNDNLRQMWSISCLDLREKRGDKILAAISSALMVGSDFTGSDGRGAGHIEVVRDELRTADGRCIEAHSVPMHSNERGHIGCAFFFRDVTEQKQALAHALHRARFDRLTGLANREQFEEVLGRSITLAKRGSRSFALMLLDIDHFKSVNDTFGHAVGDELLKQAAARLTENLREADLVARLGGDEFAIIITDFSTYEAVAALASKIVNVLGEPFQIDEHRVEVGASLGIEINGPETLDAASLLLRADTALYRVKARGRGSYAFFTPCAEKHPGPQRHRLGETFTREVKVCST